MTERSADANLSRFIESVGLRWESEGFPRIAGRIFGLMLVSEHPASLDEIAATLGVSKASVSTDARLLEHHGLLARISQPGDRRDYYHVADDAAIRALERKLESMRRTVSMNDELGDKSQLPPVVLQRLENFGRAHQRIISAMEHLLDELREPQRAPASAPSHTV